MNKFLLVLASILGIANSAHASNWCKFEFRDQVGREASVDVQKHYEPSNHTIVAKPVWLNVYGLNGDPLNAGDRVDVDIEAFRFDARTDSYTHLEGPLDTQTVELSFDRQHHRFTGEIVGGLKVHGRDRKVLNKYGFGYVYRFTFYINGRPMYDPISNSKNFEANFYRNLRLADCDN